MISVVIPTHHPNKVRLHRVLAALADQKDFFEDFEVILVDNRSEPPVELSSLPKTMRRLVRVVREDQLGLTPARICGIRQARGGVVVFVDDDNVLASNYLSVAASRFTTDSKLGACGGKALPEFEAQPPSWTEEFWEMLAIRDLGPVPLRASGFSRYPPCAPVGAGMAVRREVALTWATEIEHEPTRRKLDRSGRSLASAGDNDLVLSILKQGYEVEYVPELLLTHLIPSRRVTRDYLAELAYASSRTWVQLLRIHGIYPARRISGFGAMLRKLRSFLITRAWRGPAEYVRWMATCGIFDGLSSRRKCGS
jgi:glycosyltransferase involved in cell wall biosynthesis